jgi:hypothetical protein
MLLKTRKEFAAMDWRKTTTRPAFALALLSAAGFGFAQAGLDQPTQPDQSSPPAQVSPSTPDGPPGAGSSVNQPNQPGQLGSASTLDQPIAPGAAGGTTGQAGQTGQAGPMPQHRPDTLTQPAEPSQAGGGQGQSQGNWSELRGKIIDQKQIGVEGTDTPNTVVLLQTEDGQQVAIDLGPEGALSGANLRNGDPAHIKGVMISVGGNPVFVARELDLGGKTWQITRSRGDRFAQMGAGGEQSQVSGTIEYFEDVNLRGSGGKNRVALIQTQDGRRMLVDLGPVGGLSSIQLNRGDQVSITGHNAWVSGERSILFADQVNAGGQTLNINRPPFSPGTPESQESGGQSSQPSTSTPDQSEGTPGSQPQERGPAVPGTINFEPGQANPPLDQGGTPAPPAAPEGSQEDQGT